MSRPTPPMRSPSQRRPMERAPSLREIVEAAAASSDERRAHSKQRQAAHDEAKRDVDRMVEEALDLESGTLTSVVEAMRGNRIARVWLDRAIFVLILINSIILALYQPVEARYHLPSRLNEIVENSELAFQVIYTLELALKLTVDTPHAYWKSSWNRFDCAIILLGWAAFATSGLSVFRIARVLRPFRTLYFIPGMPELVQAMNRSASQLGSVLMLGLFLLSFYAIVGTRLFAGSLRFKCDVSNVHCSFKRNNCPINETCVDLGLNPNHGLSSFDSFPQSLLTVFVSITMEGWTDVMSWLEDASPFNPIVPRIYFVSLIVFGSFFVLNFVVAVLALNFSLETKAAALDEVDVIRRLFQDHSLKRTRKKDMSEAVVDAKCRLMLSHELFFDHADLEHPCVVDKKQYDGLCSEVTLARYRLFKHKHPVMMGRLQKLKSEHEEFQSARDTESVESLAAVAVIPTKKHFLIQLCLNLMNDSHARAKRVISSDGWEYCVAALIVYNTLVLAMERFLAPMEFAEFASISNVVVLSVFTIEACVDVYALGLLTYVSSATTRFDFAIVLTGWLDYSLSSSASFTALRAFRLLRVFRLERKWLYFKKLRRGFQAAFVEVLPFSLLVGVFVYVFSVAGLHIFGGLYTVPMFKYDEDQRLMIPNPEFDCSPSHGGFFLQNGIVHCPPRTNYDTMLNSVLATFQTITGEDWNELMYSSISEVSPWIGIPYYVFLVVSGSLILVQFFLAILIESFFSTNEPETPIFSRNNETVMKGFSVLKKKMRRAKEIDYPMCFVVVASAVFVSTPTYLFELDVCVLVAYCVEILLRKKISSVLICVVIASKIIFLNSSQVVDAIQCLRCFKLLDYVVGLRLVTSAMRKAFVPSLSVGAVVFLTYALFAMLFVSLFAGKFHYCENAHSSSACFPYRQPYSTTCSLKDHCVGGVSPNLNATWRNPSFSPMSTEYSFDNAATAFQLLLEISTLELWTKPMHDAMDITGYGLQPIRDASRYHALLFIAFLLLANFVLLSLFVTVVVDAFHNVLRNVQGTNLLSENQTEWLRTQRIAARELFAYKLPSGSSTVRRRLFRIVESNFFKNAVLLIILLNTITLALPYYNMSSVYDRTLMAFSVVFGCFYLLEALMLNAAYGPENYFQWFKFDFFVCVCVLLALVLTPVLPEYGSVFKALQAIRVVRLTQSVHLKRVSAFIQTMKTAIPALANISGVLLMVLFTYAIVGHAAFKLPNDTDYSKFEYLSEKYNFDSVANGLNTMFRTCTGESWPGVMREMAFATEKPVQVYAFCLSFEIIVTFNILNLFLAVILSVFETELARDRVDRSSVNDFKRAWRVEHKAWESELRRKFPHVEYGLLKTAMEANALPASRFPRLFRRLDPPLGSLLGKMLPDSMVLRIADDSKIPTFKNDQRTKRFAIDNDCAYHIRFQCTLRALISLHFRLEAFDERNSVPIEVERLAMTGIVSDVALDRCFPADAQQYDLGAVLARRALGRFFKHYVVTMVET